VNSVRLDTLNDHDLLAQTKSLVGDEHATTIQILHHLNEIERRRLDLDLGYSSLFDYCVTCLEYSASAAGRRILAARCIRRYPAALKLLEARELSLSTIAQKRSHSHRRELRVHSGARAGRLAS
jgi:hypothetical protein